MSFYTQTSENMDSPRSQSPKQGLDVTAMADSVLLIYFEPARPKVNTNTFTFWPLRQSTSQWGKFFKKWPHTFHSNQGRRPMVKDHPPFLFHWVDSIFSIRCDYNKQDFKNHKSQNISCFFFFKRGWPWCYWQCKTERKKKIPPLRMLQMIDRFQIVIFYFCETALVCMRLNPPRYVAPNVSQTKHT